MTHRADHEIWLAAYLANDATDDERREIEACSECAQSLVDVRAQEAALASAWAEDRALLAEARALSDAPGLAEVRRRGEALRVETANGVAPSRRPLAWLAAAALVAVGAWALLGRERPRDHGGATLDPGARIDGLEATSDASGAWTFRWRAELPAGGRFRLSIRDATTGDGTERTLDERNVQASSYTVPAETARAWPDRVEWEVSVYDASQRLDASARAYATRSR